MEVGPLDRVWHVGRTSLRARVRRWESKRWQIAQCAIAAGVAWFIASDLFGHPTPFFAPVAAVVALGTSYGQRLLEVAEVVVPGADLGAAAHPLHAGVVLRALRPRLGVGRRVERRPVVVLDLEAVGRIAGDVDDRVAGRPTARGHGGGADASADEGQDRAGGQEGGACRGACHGCSRGLVRRRVPTHERR